MGLYPPSTGCQHYIQPLCIAGIIATPRGPGGIRLHVEPVLNSSPAEQATGKTGVAWPVDNCAARQLAQGFLLTSGTALGPVHYPLEHFLPPREYAGLGVSFRLSNCLCTCQLFLYHFWQRYIMRVKVQHASLGEENAILPHDKSPCETWFLLCKETVPHFSCGLILILQTFTQGGEEICKMAVARDGSTRCCCESVVVYLHIRELLAAWGKSSFLKERKWVSHPSSSWLSLLTYFSGISAQLPRWPGPWLHRFLWESYSTTLILKTDA